MIRKSVLTGVLIVLCGCSHSQSESIDDNFLLSADRAKLDNLDKQGLTLALRTKTVYGCDGHQIVFDSDVSNSRIDIVLKRIDFTETCMTVPAPARGVKTFSLQSGKYNLTIVDGELKDSYEVTIDNTQIMLIPLVTQFTELE